MHLTRFIQFLIICDVRFCEMILGIYTLHIGLKLLPSQSLLNQESFGIGIWGLGRIELILRLFSIWAGDSGTR